MIKRALPLLFILFSTEVLAVLTPIGPAKVTQLAPRSSVTVNTGAAGLGFYFTLDGQTSYCGTSTYTFGVPKADPGNPAIDNSAYRDHVNTLMLAYALNKSVVVYVDTCMNYSNVPRVVAIDLLP